MYLCYNHITGDPLFFIYLIQPHRDTEKADGMFGTMVVQLPSDYDGGVLRVCHHGEEMTFDFSGLKGMTGFHYAAFYADCQHELCEVTRGYRMCLVYNLLYSGGGARPVPIDNRQLVNEVVAKIQDWEQDDSGLPAIAYMLNHQYCKASLSFKLLKNADRAIAEVLVEANKQKSFSLYLGNVTLHRISSGCGYSRYDMDIHEVEDIFTAGSLVSPSGETFCNIRLDNNAIVPSDVFDEADPDNEEFEATGNEGTTLDKTYHQAALLMWPKKHRAIMMGVDSSINKLESSCKKLATPGCESVAQQQQECEVMAKDIVAASKNLYGIPIDYAAVTLLSCLQQLKAATLTSEFLQALAVHHNYFLWCQSFFEAVVKSCIAFGWEQLEQALVVLFRSLAAKDSCTFLSMIADRSVSSQQLKVCQKLVNIICHVLTSEEDIAAPCVRPSWSDYSTRSQSRSKEFVCKLFKAFSVLQCEDQLKIVILSFFKQPNRYPLSTTLVPAAIELHKCMYEGTHAPLYSLLSHCVTALQCSTQKGVGTPTWSKKSDLKCSCEQCTVLATFLKDPARKVARYSMKQSKRTHLERQLAHCSDVTCTTERVGIPYTLLVTKNQQSHEAKVRKHQAQLVLLDHVLPLLKQLEKPPKCLKVDESDLIIIEH